MFRKDLFPAWIGILLLSGMFLTGQGAWTPQPCIDLDGDGYGNTASTKCAHVGFDCDDSDPDVNPGIEEGPPSDPSCTDSLDNDCDGYTDASDSGCTFSIRIMPLGDSITAGANSGVSDPAEWVSYRGALWDKLTAEGYPIDFVGSRQNGSAVLQDPDHEGHCGWRDDQILNGWSSRPDKGKLSDWLAEYRPDIVLLHIGTNGLDPSPDDVEGILNEIDNYSTDTWVILARIINQSCSSWPSPCFVSKLVTSFNDNVEAMAQDRIDNLGDKIIIVDMENGAGIDYHETTYDPPGDMENNFHPYETGHEKMADVWFTALQEILP